MENYHQYEKSRWIDKPWLIYSGVIGITAKAPNSPTKQPRVCVCVCVGSHPVSKGYLILTSLIAFQKSRGQRCPCHFLCQRSWVTCGKDIDIKDDWSTHLRTVMLFPKAALGLHFHLRLRFSTMARGSFKNPNHVLFNQWPSHAAKGLSGISCPSVIELTRDTNKFGVPIRTPSDLTVFQMCFGRVSVTFRT